MTIQEERGLFWGHDELLSDQQLAPDPLRPCNAGEKCRVMGMFERNVKGDYAQTYLIGTLISVDGAGDLEK